MLDHHHHHHCQPFMFDESLDIAFPFCWVHDMFIPCYTMLVRAYLVSLCLWAFPLFFYQSMVSSSADCLWFVWDQQMIISLLFLHCFPFQLTQTIGLSLFQTWSRHRRYICLILILTTFVIFHSSHPYIIASCAWSFLFIILGWLSLKMKLQSLCISAGLNLSWRVQWNEW